MCFSPSFWELFVCMLLSLFLLSLQTDREMTQMVLVGNDGSKVSVLREAAESQSRVLHDILDGTDPQEAVEIPIATAKEETLTFVAQYFNLRHRNAPKEIEKPLRVPLFDVLDETDRNFIRQLNEQQVMELCVTAGFLNSPSLRDLMCARLAEYVKEKNVEEIRALFGLQCDFTPEELTVLKKEHGVETL